MLGLPRLLDVSTETAFHVAMGPQGLLDVACADIPSKLTYWEHQTGSQSSVWGKHGITLEDLCKKHTLTTSAQANA